MAPKKKDKDDKNKKKSKKQAKLEKREARRLKLEQEKQKVEDSIARLHEIKQIKINAILERKRKEREHQKRLASLSDNVGMFTRIMLQFFDRQIKRREHDQWSRYLFCDRLPMPDIPSSMNTHLTYWSNLKESQYIDNILEWLEKIIELLNETEKLVIEPLNVPENTLNNWKEVIQSYRNEIFQKIDQGTFNILRNVDEKMTRVDYWTVDFKRFTKTIKIILWGWLDFPISELTIRDPPNKEFEEIGIKVVLPLPYGRKSVIIRVIHLMFDPFSDVTKTWTAAPFIFEGTIVEIADFWNNKKVELEELQWNVELEKLNREKNQLKELLLQKLSEEDKEKDKDVKIKEKDDGETVIYDLIRAELKRSETAKKEAAMKREIREFQKVDNDDENDESQSLKEVTGSVLATGLKETQSFLLKKTNSYLKRGESNQFQLFEKEKTQEYDKLEFFDDLYLNELFKEELEAKEEIAASLEEKQSPWNEIANIKRDMNLNKDFKEICLDHMFECDPSKKKEQPLLRQIISNLDPSIYRSFDLHSLKVNETLKKKLFLYFNPAKFFEESNDQETIDILEDYFESRFNTVMQKLHVRMKVSILPHEISLRKFVILGGTYYLDLINQLTPKFYCKKGWTVRVQHGEYVINKEDFFYVYEPPKIVEVNEDEEEKPPPDDNIDKLIHIEITLPEQVLWFESPTPVLWHQQEKFWSNKHVYDVKFNEEKQRINFKIGRALPIGLSSFRYNNLPYQTWELRPAPSKSNTVLFSLTASTVILEFAIRKDQVALESLQNAPGTALEPILGQFFPLNELVAKIKRAGIDVFPDSDAFLYIEGHSLKDYIVESHIYCGMAIFSPYFQFSWSRWNMQAGWGSLVYQIRQIYSQRNVPNYLMVKSDLFRTTIVKCSEVSPAFSEKPIPNIGFSADLYSLLKSICSKKVKSLIENLDVDLTNTVFQLLNKTKFFSYS